MSRIIVIGVGLTFGSAFLLYITLDMRKSFMKDCMANGGIIEGMPSSLSALNRHQYCEASAILLSE